MYVEIQDFTNVVDTVKQQSKVIEQQASMVCKLDELAKLQHIRINSLEEQSVIGLLLHDFEARFDSRIECLPKYYDRAKSIDNRLQQVEDGWQFHSVFTVGLANGGTADYAIVYR